jgi:hypothetical protein
VPVAGGFPAISIDVSVNGFYCYDYVFAIAAHPSVAGAQDETWSSLKSMYR